MEVDLCRSTMKLMRNIVISTLIIANMASAWLVPLIYVDFELRETYIAKVLCINRDNPMTVCKGSCYLSERLTDAAKQQEDQEKVNPLELIFFFESEATVLPSVAQHLSDQNHTLFKENILLSDQVSGVFHPPQC